MVRSLPAAGTPVAACLVRLATGDEAGISVVRIGDDMPTLPRVITELKSSKGRTYLVSFSLPDSGNLKDGHYRFSVASASNPAIRSVFEITVATE